MDTDTRAVVLKRRSYIDGRSDSKAATSISTSTGAEVECVRPIRSGWLVAQTRPLRANEAGVGLPPSATISRIVRI